MLVPIDQNLNDVLEVIVAEVQAHPILWNRNISDYKRSDKKRIVWRAIAEKVGLEVEQVKSKWKNLSDGFKKCLDRKRDLEKSGSGYSKPPTCRFYNQLLFLRDAVSNRNTHSNVQVQSISLGTPSSTEEALPEPLTATSVSSLGNEPPQQNQNQQPPVPPTTQPPPKEKLQFPQATVIPKKRKKVELDPVEEYLIKSIEKKEEKKSLAGKQDPDEQFCLSIIHTLRRLGEQSMKKNQLAKIKIQQLLFEIEFDD